VKYLIIRPQKQPIVTRLWHNPSVCLSIDGRDCDCCKNGWDNRDTIWHGPKKRCIRSPMGRSMFRGDVGRPIV